MAKRKPKTNPQMAVEVDIVSDFVCPWCWLGYKLFSQASTQTKSQIDLRPKLTFRPYMLDPTIPPTGLDYRDYMKAKFGDKPNTRWSEMRDQLEAAGPALGIQFDFKAITKRPNTLDAHRLMRWAQGQSARQNQPDKDIGRACAEALFTAFLEQGQDIGDPDILCDIADRIGLEAALVRELLDGENDKAAVNEEIQFFRGLGISGVPTFIYNGQLALQGAQSPEQHINVLEQAAALGLNQA